MKTYLSSPRTALRMFAADLLVFSSILSAACCQTILKVSVPKTLNSTSGSCLLIPCLFDIKKEKENLLDSSAVTWRRGSLWSLYDTPNFNDAQAQKEPAVEVVGELRQKNCTSVMRNLSSQHSDRYYFRIETSLGLKNFSMTDTKAVYINVSDSLAKPTVTMPVLREGERVNLTCTAPAPCPSHPPNVKWAPALGDEITQTTLNADGTLSVSAILSFVPSLHHHELKVNCVSIHPLHREDKPLLSAKTVTLSVEYPPKKTWISLTGSVWLGSNVTLACQSNANPPATHRWLIKRAGVEEELGISDVLAFTATQEHTGEYICWAQNPYGAMNSTNLQITVPGISFTAFLSVLAALTCLVLALLFIVIYRRYKEPIRNDTSQDENIYANMSTSAVKSQQFQPKPCEDEMTCNINPIYKLKQTTPDESIYANY
ncbi:sialic acid-binding Ig-like lectin 13 [Puntigrus tetrazona]|uniref:sialic acid-binding Ig-like lectin 13 n=1 Tax=Puntigrus tetrazona TaxID=1606681 RepID=UPI001C8AE677|nr:sialic acid-binding Ig-like lectin 13 [Puntigrus tetrazona]